MGVGCRSRVARKGDFLSMLKTRECFFSDEFELTVLFSQLYCFPLLAAAAAAQHPERRSL